jgi:hypothetical protein
MSNPCIEPFEVRVYHEDTDFLGRVYHASYLRFLERGRTELLRRLGFRQLGNCGKVGRHFCGEAPANRIPGVGGDGRPPAN